MRLRNRTLPGVLLATLTISAFPAWSQSPQGLVPKGAPPDVALIFTGDVIGYLDPCG